MLLETENKLSNFDNINQQIKALLDMISNKLQHNITLLVYSEDIESSNKLNFFELSFDNYKYFSNYHSVILNNNIEDIVQSLITKTRKKKNTNNLNDFVKFDIDNSFSSNIKKDLAILIYSLHQQCLNLQNIDNLNIYNYLQYSSSNINIFHLSP